MADQPEPQKVPRFAALTGQEKTLLRAALSIAATAIMQRAADEPDASAGARMRDATDFLVCARLEEEIATDLGQPHVGAAVMSEVADAIRSGSLIDTIRRAALSDLAPQGA